jgi:hypothetical protein
MEYYSAIKKNEIILFTSKWMELENIMVSEVSQEQKTKVTCFLSYVEDRSKYKYKHYHIYIFLAISSDIYTYIHIPWDC